MPHAGRFFPGREISPPYSLTQPIRIAIFYCGLPSRRTLDGRQLLGTSGIPPGRNEYRVLLLGAPEMRRGVERLQVRRRQVRALLYYLAHRRAPVLREQLAFLFWPDLPDTSGRRNLTRLLSAARRELEDATLLIGRQDQVVLDPQRIWLDCTAFERLRRSSQREELEEAVALYRSRFLDGFSLPSSPAFASWQDEQERQHERAYLKLLLRLIDHCHVAGDLAAAVSYARRYLAIDGLAEEVHRRLIILHHLRGERGAALRQFERCAVVLERELGVSPLPETRAAYDSARRSTPGAAAPAPAAAPVWRTLPSLNLPLVGREEARQELEAAYRRLAEGGVIFIHGEPGVGKSRLMQAFAEAQEALLLVGYSGTQALPYEPLVTALRSAFAHPVFGQGVQPLWLAEVARLLPELHTRFPGLPPPVDVEPQQAQARLFTALTQLLITLSSVSRSLLCIDDVHWADEATLGWLQNVSGQLRGSRVVILAAYRTHSVDSLHPWRRELGRVGLMADVEIGGLSPGAVAAVLRHAAEDLPNPQRLATRIHAATGGNAFFVLEVVRELLESDQLTADEPVLPLPQTVQDTVLRRVGRLQPMAQQILEVAAVLSPHLQLATLVYASGRSEMEVVEGLHTLVQAQLLADAGHIRFHHDLARETIYHSIRPWRRRILHRRAAEGLEQVPQVELASSYDDISGHIAAHYEQGDRIGKALFFYQQAVVAAQRLYALSQARDYATKGLVLLEGVADKSKYASQELDLQLLLGAILLDTEQLFDPRIEAAFERAAELSRQREEPLSQARAVRGLCYFNIHKAKLDPGQSRAEQLLGLAEKLGSGPFLIEAHWNLGAVAMFRGQFAEARKQLEQAIAYRQRDSVELNLIFGQPAELACLAYLAQTKQLLGYPDQALAQHRLATNLAQQTPHPLYTIFALIFTAQIHHYRGNHEVVLAAAERLLAVQGQYRMSYYLAIGDLYRGWALFSGGQRDEGLHQMTRGVNVMQQAPPIPGIPLYMAIAAETHTQAGKLEVAGSLLDEVWTVVKETGIRFWEAELHRVEGELLWRQGAPAATVEQHFLRAVEVARKQHAKWLELRAVMSLAHCRKSQGRKSAARQPLAEIYHWFTEGFDTPYLKVASALLAELT